MLKKGDPVVFCHADGGSAHGMEFGCVESIHGGWVAVRTMAADGRRRFFIDPRNVEHLDVTHVVVVPLKDIVVQDGNEDATPHQMQHARLVADALMRRIGDGGAVVDDVRDTIQRELLRMHSFGFMEGQGVTVSEPWDWKREEHRLASAFVRYHDFCVEQQVEDPPDAPDSARLCEFLVWAKQAIRDGGAIGAEQWARVRCSTLESTEGGEA